MKKILLLFSCGIIIGDSLAQNITQKIEQLYKDFEVDSQLRHATASLYVIDAKTGKVVFDRNSQVGLAPASTQKIITAATAFELLGKDFRYKTEFNDTKNGTLVIKPSGDPSFGSWRWNSTKTEEILGALITAINRSKSKRFGKISIDYSGWDSETIPEGWIWEDIGNYYGAGPEKMNWHENQLDVYLSSGATVGDSVRIVSIDPKVYEGRDKYFTTSKAVAAEKGSGDNAYLYFSLNGEEPNRIRGTIPVNEKAFKISVTAKQPAKHFAAMLADTLRVEHKMADGASIDVVYDSKNLPDSAGYTSIYIHNSPAMDSLVYWFLQKSINLYGEALVKTLGSVKRNAASTDTGVVVVREFWKAQGLDAEELNIKDGSGLSPQNRVTTHAQVEVLKYAKNKDWFPSFYEALPTYNGMKMKSGTIRDSKGFCGYQKADDGNEYIFSFLVNNFSGRSSMLVNKMYRVLDGLK